MVHPISNGCNGARNFKAKFAYISNEVQLVNKLRKFPTTCSKSSIEVRVLT